MLTLLHNEVVFIIVNRYLELMEPNEMQLVVFSLVFQTRSLSASSCPPCSYLPSSASVIKTLQ